MVPRTTSGHWRVPNGLISTEVSFMLKLALGEDANVRIIYYLTLKCDIRYKWTQNNAYCIILDVSLQKISWFATCSLLPKPECDIFKFIKCWLVKVLVSSAGYPSFQLTDRMKTGAIVFIKLSDKNKWRKQSSQRNTQSVKHQASQPVHLESLNLCESISSALMQMKVTRSVVNRPLSETVCLGYALFKTCL